MRQFLVWALWAIAQCGCSGTVAVPPTIANTARCVLDTVSQDIAAGMSEALAVADAALKCFGAKDAASIAAASDVWQASKAAALRMEKKP